MKKQKKQLLVPFLIVVLLLVSGFSFTQSRKKATVYQPLYTNCQRHLISSFKQEQRVPKLAKSNHRSVREGKKDHRRHLQEKRARHRQRASCCEK